MRCKLHIISLNEEFNTLAISAFGSAAICEVRDVRSVPRGGRIFVSPANSLGFMDGGIDAIYDQQMFPGCQQVIQRAIHDLGHLTRLGRPYLRVGSALWSLIDDGGPYPSALITAPTMFLPHDVSGTNNAYWAMLAVLELADRIFTQSGSSLHTIVCPSLCCGWGRMPAAEAVRQMHLALTDFEADRKPHDVECRGSQYLIWPSRDAEQPANYDNREIGVGEYADGPIKNISVLL